MGLLFERAGRKAAPVEEFQWLALIVFVAVPFPGTGAWTGGFTASVLGMPSWSGFTANFVGVVLAGLLVNLLMNHGLKYAIITGVVLFFVTTVMWSVLRSLKKSVNGLLVNLLMNHGLKYAIITGVVLFFVTTVMWSVLRSLKKSVNGK